MQRFVKREPMSLINPLKSEIKNEVISNLEEAGNKRQRRPSTPTHTHSNGLFRICHFVHLWFSRHLITRKLLTEKPNPALAPADVTWFQRENKCLSGNFSGRAHASRWSRLPVGPGCACLGLHVQVWSFSHSHRGCPGKRSLPCPPTLPFWGCHSAAWEPEIRQSWEGRPSDPSSPSTPPLPPRSWLGRGSAGPNAANRPGMPPIWQVGAEEKGGVCELCVFWADKAHGATLCFLPM